MVAAARPGEACLAGGEWPEAVERATARLAWWDGSCGGDLRERSSCRGGARHGDADDGNGAVWQRRERRQEAEKAAAARAACGHGVTVVVRGNKVDAGVLCGAAKLTAVADWRGGDSSGGGDRLELDGKRRRTARRGESGRGVEELGKEGETEEEDSGAFL